MKKYIVLPIAVIILIISFSSCESKEKTNNNCEAMYEILYKENEIYSNYLLQNINEILQENGEIKEMQKYDSLTKDYILYLEEVKHEIEKETTEIFFDELNYSEKGKEFIKKTDTYLSNAEKLVVSNNLKKRIKFVLNTGNVKTVIIDGQAKVDKNNNLKGGKIIHVFYLDYYHKGYTINQSLALFSSKKKTILEIENEFLHEIMNSSSNKNK